MRIHDLMLLNRTASGILLALAGFSAGCKQTPASTAPQPVAAHAVPASTVAQPAAPAAPQRRASSETPQTSQAAPARVEQPKVEDVEESDGPFTINGQTLTVVQHLKHAAEGDAGDDTIALLEVVDSKGVVQYRDDFAYAAEYGGPCRASVKMISGNSGAGFLLEMTCATSAPGERGPWQILSVAYNGKISALGKPFSAMGEMGDFVPGKTIKIGNGTQLLPDELTIHLNTGYFSVPVPLRVRWDISGLTLAVNCFGETRHGFAPVGCEMPAEDVELPAREQEMTFVRMFGESNDQSGMPEHVVVKKDSKVEILAGKVLVILEKEEPKTGIHLAVGPDIWVKVRVDGKEGWIHTEEDLQAIGLYQRG